MPRRLVFQSAPLVVASLALTACSAWHPIPPPALYEPFKLSYSAAAELPENTAEKQSGSGNNEDKSGTLDKSKRAPDKATTVDKLAPENEMKAISLKLEELVKVATEQAVQSNKRDWGSGDITSSGAILAAAGAIADQTGLLNTGVGVGALGATARGRYQFSTQGSHYLKASRSLTCVLNHVNTFSDFLRRVALNYALVAQPTEGGTVEKAEKAKAELLKQSALEAPMIAVDAVNKIQYQLLADLSGIGSEPTTRDHIDALVQAEQKAGSPVPNITPAQQKELLHKSQSDFSELQGSGSGSQRPQFTEEDISWLKELAAKRALGFEINVKACVVK